jgi:tyrosine phenol-lyase
MDVTAESVMAVYARRERVAGLAFTYEPEHLRFFQARFAPLTGRRIFIEAEREVEQRAERTVPQA